MSNEILIMRISSKLKNDLKDIYYENGFNSLSAYIKHLLVIEVVKNGKNK